MNSPLTLDTIVIGAGLTGLTVGHHLLKDPNHKFTILEKEERAGGQIRTLKKMVLPLSLDRLQGLLVPAKWQIYSKIFLIFLI